MFRLRACPCCGGLLPPSASTCPHCDSAVAAPSTLRRVGRTVVGVAAGAALSVTMMACYGAPIEPYDAATPPAECGAGRDQDGDGQCTPLDCDDSQPGIYTGAADPLGDGIDQNCDGQDGVRPSGP